MIKGAPIEKKSYYYPLSPLSLSPSTSLNLTQQDTVKYKSISSLSKLNTSPARLKLNLLTDTAGVNNSKLTDIFAVADARDKEILKLKTNHKIIVYKDTIQFNGNTSNIYSDENPVFPNTSPSIHTFDDNFLLKIKDKNLNRLYQQNLVNTPENKTVTVTSPVKVELVNGFEGKLLRSVQNGWYVIVILLAISLFTYCKATYQKIITQILESVYNFQLSVRLFRDKNVLFRNLSIVLQILFSLSIGIFISITLSHFQYRQVFDSTIYNIIIYSLATYLYFLFKNFFYRFLGYVFKNQDYFFEVSHHISLFNKVTGILLLPIITILPFINFQYQSLIIYFTIGILGIILILLLYRSFQIVSNKQVPFFFLILYLCTVEILPVLLLVKASKTII